MVLKSFKSKAIVIISLAFFCLPIMAKEETVVILHEKTTTETRPIYEQIITGISKKTSFNQKILQISDNNHDEITQWILKNPFFSVITIGSSALKLIRSINPKIKTPVIATGIFTKNKSNLSLSFSEDWLKKRVKTYIPNIKTIHIADDGKNIIDYSNSSSEPRFNRIEKKNEDEIIKFLWEKINTINSKTEAIWINSSIEQSFVYKLSEKAWERDVILISNNRNHLESGILLVFFPDFKGVGEKIGNQLNRLLLNGKSKVNFEPLTTIYQGINLRTAKHLSLSISPTDFQIIIK